MPLLPPATLRAYVARIFEAAGAPPEDAALVAHHLIEANLQGHDSHGVIRVERYIRDIEAGVLHPGAEVRLDRDDDTTAVVDGGWNFGQVVAHRTMAVAVEKARLRGVGIAVAHRSGHVGRVGAYGEQAADAGCIGIAMVNNHGGGRVMSAPGGLERRLSPNPIVVVLPTEPRFVLDMTTSVVAEGKLRVARNRGESVPDGWIVDAEGRPATDPAAFYGPPQGSLRPLGGDAVHKGFGLALVVEALAGALSPAGTSRPGAPSVGNGLFCMAIDVARFRPLDDFAATFAALIEYVQSPPYAPGVDHITIPGEPERTSQRTREAAGIPLDDTTWQQLLATGEKLGLPRLEAR
ncbi:MAG: Ldh family oxidoreductase [Dehalococcoidia bacterium]